MLYGYEGVLTLALMSHETRKDLKTSLMTYVPET